MWNDILTSFAKHSVQGETFKNGVTLWLGIAVLVFIVYALLLRYRKKGKLPPGPTGLPVFGYYFSLRKKPIETLKELTKKYGNVVGFYIGPKYVVYLNDWEAVKDGLGQNATLDRPIDLFKRFPYRFGFSGSNGAEWVENRRLSSKVMKDGLQKNQWEDLIEKELDIVIERIMEKAGSPIEIRSFLTDSFSNIVVNLLLGDNLEKNDATTKIVTRSVDFVMENIRTIGMVNFSETLALFLSVLGIEKIPPFLKELRDFFELVSNAVDSNAHMSSSDSFVSRFKAEVRNRQKTTENTYVSDDHLKGSIAALMVGGNETTRTSVIWALIAMAEHPDKQKKVHEELDNAIGKEGAVRWSERAKVPYVIATLLESLRWKTTTPLPTLRFTAEDTLIQGYHIPKGTFIGINLWNLHYDPRYWDHPDQFIPERFLLEDGRKVNMSPDSFIPFTYGKRKCPGQLLALMDMLQYFSALMQKFKVMPKEGDKVKRKEVLGLSLQARDAELRFIPR